MIRKALEGMGLTDGEIQVYEALLSLGLSPAGRITKQAGIASSKVYEVLQRLGRKGLVSHVLRNGVRYYNATPPERLIDFLEEKKESLSRSQAEIRKVIPELKREMKRTDASSTVVYTGSQGPKIVLNEILEAGRRGQENCGFGTDVDPYVVHMPHVLQRYIEAAKKYKFRTRLLFAKGFRSPNVNASVRYLQKKYLPPVRTMLYENKVAIVNFNGPITTIVIEDQELAKSYREHFELLWKIAKPTARPRSH
jgi:sugar-specific transcriptional regulator TrmB